jgi:hypothetical protein
VSGPARLWAQACTLRATGGVSALFLAASCLAQPLHSTTSMEVRPGAARPGSNATAAIGGNARGPRIRGIAATFPVRAAGGAAPNATIHPRSRVTKADAAAGHAAAATPTAAATGGTYAAPTRFVRGSSASSASASASGTRTKAVPGSAGGLERPAPRSRRRREPEP